MKLSVEAPAKINLRLEVLGKRPDGYHEVRLLMVAISLWDRITLEKAAEGITLACPGLPEGPENLAWRAARAFFDETALSGGARIAIEKAIPVAAGLGGGSSDAAAVLEGLDRLFGTALGIERLRRLGAGLGSDVPFFIGGAAPAWATGRGERIWPLPKGPGPAGVALVNPGFGVPTSEAYQGLNAPAAGGGALTPQPLAVHATPLPDPLWGPPEGGFFHNDLEPVVFARYPEIGEIKRRLLEAGAGVALMSGSGASVFGLCRDEGQAHDVLARAQFPEGYSCWAVRTLCARQE